MSNSAQKMVLKVLAFFVIVGCLYLAGVWGEKQKEEKRAREASIEGCGSSWFGWMIQKKTTEVLDLSGFPFDANGTEHLTSREELEKILPKYLSVESGAWPWTPHNPYLMSKFWGKFDDPNEGEKRSLAKGTRVVRAWMENRDINVRIYVRPDPEPKVVGFKVSGREKWP